MSRHGDNPKNPPGSGTGGSGGFYGGPTFNPDDLFGLDPKATPRASTTAFQQARRTYSSDISAQHQQEVSPSPGPRRTSRPPSRASQHSDSRPGRTSAQALAEFKEAFPDSEGEGEGDGDDDDDENGGNPNPGPQPQCMLTEPPPFVIRDASHAADC